MDSYRGDLLLDGEVLREGIEFFIEIDRPPGRKLYTWKGYFEVPKNCDADFVNSRQFEIRLSDGRAGVINVSGFDFIVIEFQGTGDLK